MHLHKTKTTQKCFSQLFYLTYNIHIEPEPSPESRQQGALRLCGGALRVRAGGLDIQIRQKFH